MNYSVDGIEYLLKLYDPLWATTDEDPTANFSIHARIISGISGDGTPDGTLLRIIDPAGGH
ncbi:papain-like cysteine protease family protein [Paenibacillus spongiae]|uniref:papain-like cysteine protease family protein n=1 Tax=Paenibacillus spongiae TaxID=2909671 RepID=UPI0021ACDE51|nr:papain-like cysteine protease family protein [Paenibacillus spongiae]